MIPRQLVKTLAIAAAVATASPARAQMIVHDPAAVTQLITQAQTALSQLQQLRDQVSEAQRLYASFNDLSDVNSLARQLLAPELRAFVPEVAKLEAAARGDLASLGVLADRAQAIRDAARVIADDTTPEGRDLEASGDRAARDLALGENVTEVAGERARGLDDLRSALDNAGSARAVMDIGARLAAEQALITNDQMRLQGLAMIQASEDRLDLQRRKEQAAAAQAARLAMFKQGFEAR